MSSLIKIVMPESGGTNTNINNIVFPKSYFISLFLKFLVAVDAVLLLFYVGTKGETKTGI